jgi:hypothetical protein
MAKWKTDPLLRAILSEASALWAELDEARRPQLLRVEQRSPDDSGEPDLDGSLQDVWMIDGAGVRLAPILRRERHDPGATRGDYSQFGLVRFSVSEDGLRVALDFRLGPEIGGEIAYEVEGQGDDLQIFAQAGSLSA